MCDSKKTKKMLIEELQALRSRLAELERIEAERKGTEEALRESEQCYARAAQIGHFGHWERSLANDKATWSDESCRIFGVDPSKFEPSLDNFLSLVNPSDREPLNDAIQAAISRGKPMDIEYRIVCPDGAERILHSVAEVRVDKNGQPVKLVGTAHDITEQKQAEEALRKAHDQLEAKVEERTAALARANALLKEQIAERKLAEQKLKQYQFMVESAHDAVFFKDLKSRYIIANNEALKAFGLSREQVIGKNDYEIMPDQDQARKNIEDDRFVFKTGRLKETTKHMTGADGKERWFQAIKVPQLDDKGNIIGLVGIARDIAAHKRAEEALSNERNKLVSVFEAMEDGVYVVNQQHDIQYVNPVLEKEFGPWQGRKCYQYFHDRKELCPWCKNEEVFEGKTVRWEWYSFKNQKTYDLIDTPLKNPDGSISKLEIFRDITDRKKAEEALKESEERYKALFEGAAEGILVADVETKQFTYVNPAACGMLGYTEQELTQMGVRDIHPQADLESVIADFEAQARGQKTLATNIPCLRKDGAMMYADIDAAKVVINGRECNVGFFTDITERKKAEDELEKAHDELEMRVEQRTADLARAIEELRSEIAERKKAERKLLTSQKQLRSLASELSLAEERLRRRMATDVHDHIGQNLAISKIKLESLRKSVSSPDLAGALDEIGELMARAIESSRSLTFELSPPVLYELGFEAAVEWLVRQTRQQHGLTTEFEDDGRPKPLDHDVRVLLFQAVRELLVNVAKHAQAHSVTVSVRRVGGQIQVSVEDDGVGFDTSEVSARDYKTGGFGLFSIRERLGGIDGRLDIESSHGRGTRIAIVAPIDHKSQERRERPT